MEALVALVAVTLGCLALYMRRNRGYLETLGIPMDPPGLILGSEPRAIHKTRADYYVDKFRRYGKTYGRYNCAVPCIVTMDTELIKSVTVRNFDCFYTFISEEIRFPDRVMGLNIVNSWRVWRNLRKKLSPTFTSGKLKRMLEPMENVADKFVRHLETCAREGVEVDMKAAMKGLALDVIAKCAFGIETNASKNPDHELVKAGNEVVRLMQSDNWLQTIMVSMFIGYFPRLMNLMPDKSKERPPQQTLREITERLMEEREESGMVFDDFLGQLEVFRQEVERSPEDENHKGLSREIVTAQGQLFLWAGFETTANALATLAFMLATRPDLQERVHAEVRDVITRNSGRIDQESISEMEYLEAFINENLRLHPPIVNQVRTCTKDCEIAPGLLVKRGTVIEMPMVPCHLSPEYFPEPEKFDPERFLKGNADNIIPFSYRPFGGGPRMCIAQRFALNEVKITAAKLVSKFKIVETENTELKMLSNSRVFYNFGEVRVKLEVRKTDSTKE